MSNKRIVSYYGKFDSATPSTTFGTTVQDGQSTPNLLQTTMKPVSGNVMQSHKFILAGVVIDLTSGGTLVITPDLTLLSSNGYQLVAHATVITQQGTGVHHMGHYIITTSTKGNVMMSGSGYKVDVVVKDTDMDAYLPDTGISLSITTAPTKFTFIYTPLVSLVSIDVMMDININTFAFSTHTA